MSGLQSIYEVYYQTKDGEIFHCFDTYDEQEAIREVYSLASEHIENNYWYEEFFEERG